jgi:hypothetical protein
MPPSTENASSPIEDLDAAADQAIAACGGDAREAVKAFAQLSRISSRVPSSGK